MYKVISAFIDLQDEKHLYNVGDSFPRMGKAVTDDRLNELASGRNATGKPLIQLVEDSNTSFVQVVEEPVVVEKNEEPKLKRKRTRENAD